jgi:hypothetical protein
VHLPDQDLRGFGRGDLLPAGRGEPDRVAGGEGASALERDRAAWHEQVQERRLGQLDGLTWLEAGDVEGGVLVLDADGGGAGTRLPESSSWSISSCS